MKEMELTKLLEIYNGFSAQSGLDNSEKLPSNTVRLISHFMR